jgi:F0F1-type ATP synthase membrane subunit a
MPVMPTGRGVLSKVVTVMVVLALLMLVVKYPSDAAHFLTGTMRLASNIIGGLVTFFRQVTR